MASFTAVTPTRLVDAVVRRCDAVAGRVIMTVDGADAAHPVAFATEVVRGVRERGRPADVVDLHDFVRPASLRLEHGREDEISYRTAWFDYAALAREVIDALHVHGRWLPRLWDERRDRSARARVQSAADDHLLVVAGPMLAGRGLDVDVSVVLRMSEGALRRRTSAEDAWTIPALLAHVPAEAADILVRYDHPDRPAMASR
ncbi:hypothetical protein [Rhodococcus sp. HNM0569]|uniref:hypothetical protein n=1 Tax=Rhodococcus sp. HNM0569 TaxID=2716340 RepID=UPI00146B6D51|nr:hypothetical protein [Rhodococcus sp. HNM0569]NLU81304.1 hypothetical protein [Rhodococcus sp. HNM0569]